MTATICSLTLLLFLTVLLIATGVHGATTGSAYSGAVASASANAYAGASALSNANAFSGAGSLSGTALGHKGIRSYDNTGFSNGDRPNGVKNSRGGSGCAKCKWENDDYWEKDEPETEGEEEHGDGCFDDDHDDGQYRPEHHGPWGGDHGDSSTGIQKVGVVGPVPDFSSNKAPAASATGGIGLSQQPSSGWNAPTTPNPSKNHGSTPGSPQQPFGTWNTGPVNSSPNNVGVPNQPSGSWNKGSETGSGCAGNGHLGCAQGPGPAGPVKQGPTQFGGLNPSNIQKEVPSAYPNNPAGQYSPGGWPAASPPGCSGGLYEGCRGKPLAQIPNPSAGRPSGQGFPGGNPFLSSNDYGARPGPFAPSGANQGSFKTPDQLGPGSSPAGPVKQGPTKFGGPNPSNIEKDVPSGYPNNPAGQYSPSGSPAGCSGGPYGGCAGKPLAQIPNPSAGQPSGQGYPGSQPSPSSTNYGSRPNPSLPPTGNQGNVKNPRYPQDSQGSSSFANAGATASAASGSYPKPGSHPSPGYGPSSGNSGTPATPTGSDPYGKPLNQPHSTTGNHGYPGNGATPAGISTTPNSVPGKGLHDSNSVPNSGSGPYTPGNKDSGNGKGHPPRGKNPSAPRPSSNHANPDSDNSKIFYINVSPAPGSRPRPTHAPHGKTGATKPSYQPSREGTTTTAPSYHPETHGTTNPVHQQPGAYGTPGSTAPPQHPNSWLNGAGTGKPSYQPAPNQASSGGTSSPSGGPSSTHSGASGSGCAAGNQGCGGGSGCSGQSRPTGSTGHTPCDQQNVPGGINKIQPVDNHAQSPTDFSQRPQGYPGFPAGNGIAQAPGGVAPGHGSSGPSCAPGDNKCASAAGSPPYVNKNQSPLDAPNPYKTNPFLNGGLPPTWQDAPLPAATTSRPIGQGNPFLTGTAGASAGAWSGAHPGSGNAPNLGAAPTKSSGNTQHILSPFGGTGDSASGAPGSLTPTGQVNPVHEQPSYATGGTNLPGSGQTAVGSQPSASGGPCGSYSGSCPGNSDATKDPWNRGSGSGGGVGIGSSGLGQGLPGAGGAGHGGSLAGSFAGSFSGSHASSYANAHSAAYSGAGSGSWSSSGASAYARSSASSWAGAAPASG